MKKTRQEMIRQIIEENSVGTQEELLAILIDRGVNVTQATVSRDIKEMRIVKKSNLNGEYKYFLPKENEVQEDHRLYSIIANAILSTDVAMNTVVVKCHPGTAAAVASAADALNSKRMIAGTIAGNDTVFALCYSLEDAEKAKKIVDEMFGL